MKRSGYNLSFRASFVMLLFCVAVLSLRAAEGMFPKMPSAPKAYVFEISKDSENAKMTAWCLQGLVNQASAEVYLINNPWDVEPLEYCGKPFERIKKIRGPDAGLKNLFQKYQGQVKKMFV